MTVDPPGSGDYADPTHHGKLAGHEWIHAVSEIIGSLLEAGLQIEFFHEFPLSVCGAACHSPKNPRARLQQIGSGRGVRGE